MAKFKITKKISLAYLGEEWKECYLEFDSPTYDEIKKAVPDFTKEDKIEAGESAFKFLEDSFIGGKAISEGGIVDVKKEDLGDFPMDVVTKCLEELMGTPSPKV